MESGVELLSKPFSPAVLLERLRALPSPDLAIGRRREDRGAW